MQGKVEERIRIMIKNNQDYFSAVKQRYDEGTGEGELTDIYSIANPVGRYGQMGICQIGGWMLHEAVHLFGGFKEIKILDVGCGRGGNTRLFAEMIGSPDRVHGFDLSKRRVEYANTANPAIDIVHGDLVKNFPKYDFEFECVTAFDVFMFLRERKDILQALRNINCSMKQGGLFLWYDVNAKSHFSDWQSDSCGYRKSEMDQLAMECGFELYKHKGLYKKIHIGRKETSTYYQFGKLGNLLTEFLNVFWPSEHLINVRIYRKGYEVQNKYEQ